MGFKCRQKKRLAFNQGPAFLMPMKLVGEYEQFLDQS